MRMQDILSLTRDQPFKPFRVFTSSGETYDIRHPDMIAVSLGAVVIAKSDPNHSHDEDWESFKMLSLYHIQKIEYLTPLPPKPGANGAAMNPAN